MRQRITLATVVTALIPVLLLGVPLAWSAAIEVEKSAIDSLQAETEFAVFTIVRDPSHIESQLESFHQRSGTRFQLWDVDGTLHFDTNPGKPLPAFARDLEQASEGAEGRGNSGGWMRVAIPLTDENHTTVAILRGIRSNRESANQRTLIWVSIAVFALASVFLSTLVALGVARRLAEPLEQLAATARELGEGDFSARAEPSGVPEADEVGTALNVTATQLGRLIERTRSFGADASHQLRTPLTALRLDLEALQLTGVDETLMDAALFEADRLEATIDEFLTLADAPLAGQLDETLDLLQLIESRLASWHALANAEDREVVLDLEPVPNVVARSAAVGQSLQVLLDNALEHGEGNITVSLRETAAGNATVQRGWVRVCVDDEGNGFTDQATPGRGLRLARSLIQAEGGRISIEKGARVCLLIPAEDTPSGPPLELPLNDVELE